MKSFVRVVFVLLLSLISDQIVAKDIEENFEAFDQQLFDLRKAKKICGVSGGIVKDGKLVWSNGYGFADADQTIAVNAETPYWIASATKTFIGLLFLKLEEQGKVNLSDRINDVPKWSDFCSWLSGSGNVFGQDLRCDSSITIDQILHHTVNGVPGESFRYNPIVFSRLSRYLEHKLGKSVEEVEGKQNSMAQLVEDLILKPAGMQRTMSSLWQREKCQVYFEMAQGFGLSENGKLIKRPLPDRELAGGAGIVSTIADLARYDAALDSGALASKKVMGQLFTPAKGKDGKDLPYAYGWYVQDYRGLKLYWHSGWDPEAGYSSLLLKVPEHRMTLILLANGEGIWWNNPLDAAMVEQSSIARGFLDLFVPEK